MNLLRLASGLIQCLQNAPADMRLRILALVVLLAAFGILAGIIYWYEISIAIR